MLISFHGPSRFAQQPIGFDLAADRVQHAPIGGAEIAGDVAAVLLDFAVDVDDLEVARLLVGGDEMLLDVFTDFGVRQSARSECLGVVSRELLAGKVAGDLDDEQQFFLLGRQRSGFFRRSDPVDGRPQFLGRRRAYRRRMRGGQGGQS